MRPTLRGSRSDIGARSMAAPIGHHSIRLIGSRSDLGEQYFLCITGAQNDEWLRSPDWKQPSNVRKVMEQWQLSVSIKPLTAFAAVRWWILRVGVPVQTSSLYCPGSRRA